MKGASGQFHILTGGVPKRGGGACESLRLSNCVLVQPDGLARGEREGDARRPWGASRRWSPAHGEVVDGGGRRFELKPLVHSQGRGDGGAMGAMRRALAAAGPWCNRWWPQNDIASPRARRCISNYS